MESKRLFNNDSQKINNRDEDVELLKKLSSSFELCVDFSKAWLENKTDYTFDLLDFKYLLDNFDNYSSFAKNISITCTMCYGKHSINKVN